MFLVNVKVELGETSEKYHSQHAEFLQQQFANQTFLIFGRNLSREASGLIIAQAESEEALRAVLAQDPYIQHGCATIEIEQFAPAQIAENIHQFN